ncbi:FecR family protein [Salegentibacter mishustinae]|uniref:Iron dicitrate transport regulator FecR n=1 Tax=Salegentibacter mishustinae TaxID=270918 RepID=A0A0Q9ZMW6_9FLAO|nr:FecR family protein [Salegentibacter mishustinae]KRG30532.1 hypothetical protein APR42_01305 [Salegentibacter mishustinae]PNW23423.1 hypothetical protein APB85_01300 [Salegentibacter mishustinae]PZX66490.1 FecR family protein [Salegentibacter mishustinae]GGW82843.1 hypothetical protein GCM10008086_08520 [Salegentibacter mishustinae]
MNKPKNIKYLLKKFALNRCSGEEIEQIIAYYRDAKIPTEDHPGVEEINDLYIKLPELSQSEANKISSRILKQPKRKKSLLKPNKFRWSYATAAALAGIILIGAFFNHIQNPESSQLIISDEQITLEDNNGSIEKLEEGKETLIKDAQGNTIGFMQGDKLIYNTINEKSPQNPEYNTIKVPFGKKFEISLSDGTRIHLNAGTTIRFPVNFSNLKERQVSLSGEAYFDVTKNKEKPFIVNSHGLNTKVYGTEFNVSAYPNEKYTNIVLVEGSVGLYDDLSTGQTMLVPGELGSYEKYHKNIETKKVPTGVYTSWINGELVFRDATLDDILEKLERHFNVTIVNKTSNVSNETFNANFGDQPVEKVLEYLDRIYEINYIIENNKIIIK